MRGGNEAAFEIAYERHGPGMLAMCRQILGSPEDAEEALQQSLASAWSHLQRSDRRAPACLKPWLYTVARNQCRSMLRARQPEALNLDERQHAVDLVAELDLRTELRALLADLTDLPEEQRAALILSEIVGLSHADIAAVLDRQVTGIKSLVFHARTTLSDWRAARDALCAEVRAQLLVLRGGALRRRALRRHLELCDSCRAFREATRSR
jgi:RNA polymerase sigma-70 factor (ECF subfamily)